MTLASKEFRLASPPTLRSLVVARIREAIIDGRFAAGSRLIERELCDLMGVSRTSVREALRELESEGLITHIANRGPIVSTLTAKEARSIFQVRAELEGLAAALFADTASDDQMLRLEAATDRLAAVYDAFEPGAFLREKQAFYDILLEGADNDALAAMLRTLLTRIARLRVVSLAKPKRPQASIKEIRALLAALRARDGKTARAISIEHVQNAASAALSVLNADGTHAD